MQQKRQSTVFTLILFCASFSLLLAACGSQHPSSTANHYAKNRSALTIPITPAIPLLNGRVYIGELPEANAWLALAANHNTLVAFTTNGSQNQAATFAQWFKGPIINNHVQTTPAQLTTPTPQDTPIATATTTSAQATLSATLTQNVAIGTLILNDGKSFRFTANAVNSTDKVSGLYSSEMTINGTTYLAGWIIPSGATLPSPADTISNTEDASNATATATPDIGATTTSTDNSNPGNITTPVVVPTLTAKAPTGPSPFGGSAIIDEQSTQLVQNPIAMLSAQDLADKQTLSSPGTFTFHQCGKNQC